MNVYLKMDDCIELEEWCVKNIDEGTSFKAVNTDGQIIGVILNAFMHKPVKTIKYIIFQIKFLIICIIFKC